MRTYVAIDLKSYYASAEAADRKYNPLTTHLVVADSSRTEKTICLAVSPSLKAYGISGRARLFEVVQRVKEVNAERFQKALKLGVLPKDENGVYHFASSSFDAEALAADPALELSYVIAPPRMRYYEEVSTKIFSIYKKYISPEDIHVYSIDECFLDVTRYLETYHLTAHELAMSLIREVLFETGITATAGIGTNMYLAKIAMDIVAKHVAADKDGVRIAELDEMRYRELLWCHRPLTDFWRVGHGIARRLENMGLYTMGDVARRSVTDEESLYKEFGINAELLIDHAWGWEPTEIKTIKVYRPEATSISSGQVLAEPYTWEKGKLIVREMTELLVLDLVRKGLVTKKMELTIGYDRESLKVMIPGETWRDAVYSVASTGEVYEGKVTLDPYGRPHPKHAHGTGNLEKWSNGTKRIMAAMMRLYDEKVDSRLLVRRVNIAAVNLLPENEIPEEQPKGVIKDQMSFFDIEELDTAEEKAKKEKKAAEEAAEAKERRIQKATLAMQAKYGKNAILKGTNFMEGATTRERNMTIGGHKAGDEE
ncbi:MAG: DNA methylase [Oscillospiraceae bacterium]|nr:DNA methylase [Oscillospiraceae bacterium]